MLDLNLKLELSENIVLRSVGNMYWALDISSGGQYKLNEVSYFILDSFRTSCTIAEMEKMVFEEYEVPHERLELDCDKVVAFALDKKILKEVIA